MIKSGYLFSVIASSILLLSGCGGSRTDMSSGIVNLSQTDAQSAQKDKLVPSNVVNSTPQATFDAFSINKNQEFHGALSAVDADGDRLEYRIVEQCAHGVVHLSSEGYFTYKPHAGYKGHDSFTYIVKDALSSSTVKKVEIDVVEVASPLPKAPTNLKLEALGVCKVRVSWEDSSTNESGFGIYQDGALVSVVKENVTTADICGGMKPATEYRIAVVATNIAGASKPLIGYVKTKDITMPPQAPRDLKVVAVDKDSVRLVWEDSAWSESAYDIYRDGVWIKALPANSESVVISNLEAAKTYTFEVVAKNKIGGSASEMITVTTEAEPVVDTEAPNLTLIGKPTLTLSLGDTYEEYGAKAVDAIDGNLTEYISISSNVDTAKAGNYEVIYRVKDSSGNEATLRREVIVRAPVVDLEPTLTIIGTDVELTVGDLYVEEGAKAEDKEDGALEVTISSTVNTAQEGDYTVTYSATDSAGHMVTKSRNVHVRALVIPNTKPLAKSETVTTPQDSNLTITLKASDADGDTLTYHIVKNPEHGTISGTAPLVTYTPDAGFFGEDSFTFVASDASDDSQETNISINVTQAALFEGEFAQIKTLIHEAEIGVRSDVTFITVGDSTRADDNYYGGGELFAALKSSLDTYHVNALLQAKAGHTARKWNNYDGNATLNEPTWEDTLSQIAGDGDGTIVSISLGVNDARYYGDGGEKERIIFHLEEAMDKILAQKPKTHFLLTMPHKLIGLDTKTAAIKAAYEELATKREIPLISTMDALFSGAEDLSLYRDDDATEYGEDIRIHLSSSGQRLVSDFILQNILP